MNRETRVCKNCSQDFSIESDDFLFYEKIQVPPPTWCPQCRFQRRLAFFNLTQLYIRKCDLCGKDAVSIFHPDAPYCVYCPKCWWSDGWDPYVYGRDYDFSRPFFEQISELWHEVPQCGLFVDSTTLVNSDYVNHAGHAKNCYLIFQADFNEECAYGISLQNNKSLVDSSFCLKSELCYDTAHSYKNSRCVGLRSQVAESIDCMFLRDCMNCQNCFASANLRNKKYYIFNKPYTKEQYFEEIKKYDLGSYRTYQDIQKQAHNHWKKFPPKPAMDEFSIASSGSYYFQTKNCIRCFEVVGAEDSKFLFWLSLPPINNCYDVSAGGNNIQLMYESCAVGENSAQLKFCFNSGINLHHAEYAVWCIGGGNIFWSASLKKGQYAILNKRYPKEEYHAFREKIIRHMNEMPYTDSKGRVYRYGEFFPPAMSPFAYNETLAQRFFPLSREEAVDYGYGWYDSKESSHVITQEPEDVPDHIKDASDSILNEIIRCGTCAKGVKIIPMELAFLRNMNLPLPRRCPFCRIGAQFGQWVKGLRVFTRICSHCQSVFETNYSQEEVEYILCKQCYQAELE